MNVSQYVYGKRQAKASKAKGKHENMIGATHKVQEHRLVACDDDDDDDDDGQGKHIDIDKKKVIAAMNLFL